MQDLLKKIISMDEQARKAEQEAKAEKIKSEEEIEALKEQIYNDYIVRARERVEKNIAVDRAHAEEKLEAYQKQVDDAKADMQKLYDEKHDQWVDVIVSRTIAR